MSRRAAARRSTRAGASGSTPVIWIAGTGVVAAIAVGLVVALTVTADDGSGGEASSSGTVSRISFETIDGETRSLASYGGRPLVINFFASWCVPCLVEMPGFEEVHQRLGDRVSFVGLNLQDRVEDGQRVVDQTGITYDVGRDVDGSIFQQFGGFAMPSTVFIDAGGEVVVLHSGEISARELEAKINAELLS